MNIGGLKKQISSITQALKSVPEEIRSELQDEVQKLAKLFQADSFEPAEKPKRPKKVYAGFVPTTSTTKPKTNA